MGKLGFSMAAIAGALVVITGCSSGGDNSAEVEALGAQVQEIQAQLNAATATSAPPAMSTSLIPATSSTAGPTSTTTTVAAATTTTTAAPVTTTEPDLSVYDPDLMLAWR